MKNFTLVVALFFCVNYTSAQPTSFKPLGPGGGGYMYVPSISPHAANHLFVNCDMGGVYRSQDGAQTFRMLDRDQIIGTVKGKVQFSADPNILFVCRRSLTKLEDPRWRGELAKSADGGATWQSFADPTSSGVHRLEVDPGSTQRMILNEYDRMFFTSDQGATWGQIFQPSSGNMWLGGVVWDGEDIYVGTNEGLLVSHNNGASFAIENHSGLPAGVGIYQLSGAKSGTSLRLFCITALAADMVAWAEPLTFRGNLKGIFKINNYTNTEAWVNTSGNIPGSIEIGWVDLAKNNTEIVWAAAADASGLPYIFKSIDGGQSWENTYLIDHNENIRTGWAGDQGPFSYQWGGGALGFDVDDTNPDHVIESEGYGHVTTDGGVTWRVTYVHPNYQNAAGQITPTDKFYKSSGLDVTSAHHIYWKNDQEMFVCNTDIGQTYSADAGDTWTFAHNIFAPWGTVSSNNWYRMLRRPDNGHLFAAVSEMNDAYLDYRTQDFNIEGAGGFVAKSIDNGMTWDTLYNFGNPVVWLEINQNNPAQMYASVVHHTDGGIFQSMDGGVSWTKMPAPPRTEGHPYNIVSLADGGLVVTFSARDLDGGGNLSQSSGVFYLPNGANTWQDRTAPAMEYYTKDLIVDPHDPMQNTWYATVWGRTSTFPGPINQGNGGLYRSIDRGQTWTRIFAEEQTESITIHPTKPGVAYVTVETGGLFFTENLGASANFTRVTSFPFWRPKRVFFKPGNAAQVWLTTMGGGIWEGTETTGLGYLNDHSSEALVYPNPFAGEINIEVSGASREQPDLQISDEKGRLVRRLLAGNWSDAGVLQFVWDGLDSSGHELPDGVYFYQLIGEKAGAGAGKLMLIR